MTKVSDEKLNEYTLNEISKNTPEHQFELKILTDIKDKYKISPIDLILVSIAMMKLGYGRNPETANILRAVAEMIESPIPCRETIEAKIEGKLQ